MTTKNKQSLLDSLEQMSATELRRVLAEHLEAHPGQPDNGGQVCGLAGVLVIF